MTDLHRALVKSTGECRYPINDGTDHCRECGWRLVYVRDTDFGRGFVIGYYRHNRRAGRLPADNPHESRTKLPLSEAESDGGPSADAPAVTDRTPAAPGVIHDLADITRCGAGGRLLAFTVDQLAAWKAAVA